MFRPKKLKFFARFPITPNPQNEFLMCVPILTHVWLMGVSHKWRCEINVAHSCQACELHHVGLASERKSVLHERILLS